MVRDRLNGAIKPIKLLQLHHSDEVHLALHAGVDGTDGCPRQATHVGKREIDAVRILQVLVDEKAAPEESSYLAQLQHLVEVIGEGADSPLHADAAVATMELLDDVYRAAGLEPR